MFRPKVHFIKICLLYFLATSWLSGDLRDWRDPPTTSGSSQPPVGFWFWFSSSLQSWWWNSSPALSKKPRQDPSLTALWQLLDSAATWVRKINLGSYIYFIYILQKWNRRLDFNSLMNVFFSENKAVFLSNRRIRILSQLIFPTWNFHFFLTFLRCWRGEAKEFFVQNLASYVDGDHDVPSHLLHSLFDHHFRFDGYPPTLHGIQRTLWQEEWVDS